MILPDDILIVIREYSKPLGIRLDWKQGTYHGAAIRCRISRIQYEMTLCDIDTYMNHIKNTLSLIERQWILRNFYFPFLKSRGIRTNK
jgi:hypothetical protein